MKIGDRVRYLGGYGIIEQLDQTHGYVRMDDGQLYSVSIDDILLKEDSDTSQQPIEDTISLYGWLCPACGKGNAPSTAQCSCPGSIGYYPI